MSGAETALKSAILVALAEDEDVRAVLGETLRVREVSGVLPAYPYLEIVRHSSEPAGAAGVEGSRHVVDLAVMSRNDGGREGLEGLAAVRKALQSAVLAMAGWRCVLLTPVFADVLRQTPHVWRALLRVRCVLEET